MITACYSISNLKVIYLYCASECSTLRRWRNDKLVEFWEAHNAPIQAVIRLPSGELVSGLPVLFPLIKL